MVNNKTTKKPHWYFNICGGIVSNYLIKIYIHVRSIQYIFECMGGGGGEVVNSYIAFVLSGLKGNVNILNDDRENKRQGR